MKEAKKQYMSGIDDLEPDARKAKLSEWKELRNKMKMELKEERVYPFIVTIVFYFLAYYTLKKVQISEVYHLFLIGSTIMVFFSLLINFITKNPINLSQKHYFQKNLHILVYLGMLINL